METKVKTDLNTQKGLPENAFQKAGPLLESKRAAEGKAILNEKLLDAARGNNFMLARKILLAGADPNVQDAHGWSALHLACSRTWKCQFWIAPFESLKHKLMDKRIDKHRIEFMGALVSKGVDVELRDNNGESALFLAARGWFYTESVKGKGWVKGAVGSFEAMKFLVEHGVNVNARSDCGHTPLMFVSTIEKAELLLNAGADINAQDKWGEPVVSHGYMKGLLPFFRKHGATGQVDRMRTHPPFL